ncbi:hypothetical protein [Soonwooa sp.]|uniref:hypothetical protein n=1 Tax=Soonwooa sp. TaxID=1938592 RepID=UPI00262C3F68|nr:hypothetical protein [Soonwooa sp.]
MMKKIILGILFLFQVVGFAQQSTGGVGIGNTNPQAKLHVTGSLRLDHPSEGNGYILQVFNGGSMKWSPLIPNAVTGTLIDPNGYSGDIPSNVYLNGQVTVSPGKWLVKVSLLIPTDGSANALSSPAASMRYNDIIIKVITYFTDSKTNATPTVDYIPGGAQQITGSLVTPSMYGMVEGYALVENKTAANKTYYLWGRSTRRSVSTVPATQLPLFKIAGTWGENRIFAYPISTGN